MKLGSVLDHTGAPEQEPEAVAAPVLAASTSAFAAPAARSLGGRPGAVLAMQRGVGNALTARMLARQRMTVEELRGAGGPAELVELLASLHATKDLAMRQRLALDVIAACDRALDGDLPSDTASKVRALRRQAKEIGGEEYAKSTPGAIPTYDTTDKAEKWTTADAPGSGPQAGDNRRSRRPTRATSASAAYFRRSRTSARWRTSTSSSSRRSGTSTRSRSFPTGSCATSCTRAGTSPRRSCSIPRRRTRTGARS